MGCFGVSQAHSRKPSPTFGDNFRGVHLIDLRTGDDVADTHEQLNPIVVFLSIDPSLPQASFFKAFCKLTVPSLEGQPPLSFFRCSTAVSEGSFLRVEMMGSNHNPVWAARIPSQYVLFVQDTPWPESKKIGYL